MNASPPPGRSSVDRNRENDPVSISTETAPQTSGDMPTRALAVLTPGAPEVKKV